MRIITDEQQQLHYIKKYHLDDVIALEDLMKGQLIHYQKEDVILRCGDIFEYFFFFLEGKIKILSVLENGKSLLLRFYTELDTLGDIEFFYPGHTDSTVESVTDSYLLKLPMTMIREKYADNPVFLKFIGRSLSNKLKSLSNNSAYNLYYPLINRLSSYIYEHTSQQQLSVVLQSSYQDISEFLGTTYRHLNRTFHELENMGVIQIKGKQIDIVDLDALKALAKNLYR